MRRFAHPFTLTLLLAAAGLVAGCSGGGGNIITGTTA
jgi:hypothetical protein